jgi:hypothetical protein
MTRRRRRQEEEEDRRKKRVNRPYQPDSYSYSPGNDI